MNDNGEIKAFKNAEEAKAAGYDIELSREEADQLMAVEREEDRQMELFWIRFWQHQKKFRTPADKMIMRHAFVIGYKTAAMNLKEKLSKTAPKVEHTI